MYLTLNSELEEGALRAHDDNRDFYSVYKVRELYFCVVLWCACRARSDCVAEDFTLSLSCGQVDNHIHLAAAMTSKHV